MNKRTHTVICEHCEAEFQGQRSTARYCSHSCRQMSYAKRLNQREKEWKEQNKYPIQSSTVNSFYNKSDIQSIEKRLASITEAHVTLLPSTKEAYTGSYRQSISNKNERDSDETQIIRVNSRLKSWINELLRIESEEETHPFKIRKLLHEIKYFWNNEKESLSKDYAYTDFITNQLIHRLQTICEQLQSQQLKRFKLIIEDDFKTELEKVFFDINENNTVSNNL